MKKFLLIFIGLGFLVFSPLQVFAQIQTPPPEERHEAKVLRIVEEGQVEAQVLEGSLKDKKVVTQKGGIIPTVGDKISITHIKNIDGSEQFYVADFIRLNSIYFLAIAFLIAVIVVGGIKGLSSFIGLIISFIVLIKYIIPKIVAGADPVFVAVSGSLMIMIATLYLAHGLSRRTTAAVLGTFFSLIITAVLASVFVSLSKLSGMASEQASFLSMFPGMQVNLKGILLGGIIIGALGVLDDITISQSACVFELKDANKSLGVKELWIRGLRIGREHIASLVNTLVLAYAGASLPLLLLFTLNGGEPLNVLLNREMIATEIVRTLVGSIGLVAAVPITTAIAAFMSNYANYKKINI
ncbi:YibE/F family protein [Candidatus Daviesbacteria bacterium]|nr:YibE/F family protein [Candidatus Daviesbacteria bacterium]